MEVYTLECIKSMRILNTPIYELVPIIKKKSRIGYFLYFHKKKIKFVRIKYMKLHTLEFLISMKMLNGQILNLDPKKCKLNEKYERKYALF